jgi:hypothetical protein
MRFMLKNIYLFIIPGVLLLFLLLPAGVSGENIVITTDRDVYVAGDRLYFSMQLTGFSGNASDYGYISLFGSSGNNICNGCLKFDKNLTNGSIYLTDTLVTGFYQLVSYTNCMRNSGQSSFARKNILIINRFDRTFSNFFQNTPIEISDSSYVKPGNSPQPEIALDKSTCKQREKLSFRVIIPETWTSGTFSLSVRQKTPVSFITPESSAESVSRETPCYYLPEKSGIVLQGILKDDKKTPVKNGAVFLTCVDTTANLQHAVTGPGGLFRFFLNPYYFGKTIMIKSDNTFKGFIETDNRYITVQPSPHEGLMISGDVNQFVENSQKYLTIQKSYKNDFLREEKSFKEKGYRPQVFDVATQVVYPSDFTYLPNFMEISREILPLVRTRETRDGYVGSIINLDLNEYTGLFIFVDGILVEDVNQIISFDSKMIRKIETIPNTRFIGKLSIPGILSITTATREIYKLPWKYPMARLLADSIMVHASYVPPVAGSIPRNIPDYRQLLLWEPSLDFGEENTITLETCTSDCTGEFEIVLTCPDEKGRAMEFKRNFYVNR